MNYLQFLIESIIKKVNYKVVKFPSDLAIEYLKKDKEISKYLNKLIKDFKGEIIIDTDNNKLIGNVFVNYTKEKGFMTNLEVKEDYQKQGFGTMLLNDAIKKYKAKDLTVDMDNEIAIKMYEKHGFKKVGFTFISNKYIGYYMKRM